MQREDRAEVSLKGTSVPRPAMLPFESLGILQVVCLVARIERMEFELWLDKRKFVEFEVEPRIRLGFIPGIFVAELFEKLIATPVFERRLGMEARAGVRR